MRVIALLSLLSFLFCFADSKFGISFDMSWTYLYYYNPIVVDMQHVEPPIVNVAA